MVAGWEHSGCRGFLKLGCFVVILGGIAFAVFREDVMNFLEWRAANQRAMEEQARRSRRIYDSVILKANIVVAGLVGNPIKNASREFAEAQEEFSRLQQKHDEPLFGLYRELTAAMLADGGVPTIRKKEFLESLDSWAQRPCDLNLVDRDRFDRAFDLLGERLWSAAAKPEAALADAKALATGGLDSPQKRELIATLTRRLDHDTWRQWVQADEKTKSFKSIRSREEELFDFTRRFVHERAGVDLTTQLLMEIASAVGEAAQQLDQGRPLPRVKEGTGR